MLRSLPTITAGTAELRLIQAAALSIRSSWLPFSVGNLKLALCVVLRTALCRVSF